MSDHDPGLDVRIVLRAARLADGHGEKAREDAALIVSNGRIESIVGSDSVDGERLGGATVIDLEGLTLMPGMFDLHTHLTAWANSWKLPFDRGTRYAFQAAANLGSALDAGVTTIRDVGSFEDVAVLAREAVARGVVAGPRVVPCRKAVTITGGLSPATKTMHIGPTDGWMQEADGSDGIRGAVRTQLKASAEWIKLYFEHGNWTTDELNAAVDEAHSTGVRVACHATRPEAIDSVIDAGVDTIEHAWWIEREQLERMRERGIAWVPTLFILDNLEDIVEEGALTRMRDHHRAAFQIGLEVGVEIGCGVDPIPDEGRAPFAAVADELDVMGRLGMSQSGVVRVATSGSAAILGVGRDVGSLSAGKAADVIAVAGDPLTDASALRDVRFVMRDGVVVRDRMQGHGAGRHASPILAAKGS